MRNDDYHVIVFKTLTYLYACLKRVERFEPAEYLTDVLGNIQPDYLIDVLVMIAKERYIGGLDFHRDVDSRTVVTSDYDKMEITPDGIEYLFDNPKMQEVKSHLQNNSIGFSHELVKRIF